MLTAICHDQQAAVLPYKTKLLLDKNRSVYVQIPNTGTGPQLTAPSIQTTKNKAFIVNILHPGLAMPGGALYFTTLSPYMIIPPNITKRDVIHKIGSTQCSATPPEEDQATATGDLYTKFCAIGKAVPEICLQADRHTDRQIGRCTDRWVDHNTPHPYRGGVTISEQVNILHPWCTSSLHANYTQTTCNKILRGITQYSRINTDNTIPETRVKKLGLRNLLGRLFMHRLKLFSLLGEDVWPQCWHTLQLNHLTRLHVNCSTLGVQDHRRCPEQSHNCCTRH